MNDQDIIQAMKTKYPQLSGAVQDADILGAAKVKHPALFQSTEYQAAAPIEAPKKTFGQKIVGGMMAANKFMTGKTGAEGPTSFKESAQQFAAPAVGLFAGLGKVAEKTTGGAMNYLGQKMFGPNYASTEGASQAGAQAILGDQTQGGAYQIGETVGKNLPSVAVTAGLGPMGGGLFARTAKGALGGAVNTQATSLMTEGRLATPTETVIGSVLGGGFGGAFGAAANKTKKVLDVIKETESAASKRAALVGGKLEEQRGGLMGKLFGGKDVVKPSNRSVAAADTIVSEIKDASSKPVKLYGQVTDKIGEIATGLGDRLKQMKIGTMTKTNAAIKTTLKDLAAETADISKNTASKITQLGTNIAKSKTANDVWDAAKQLDDLVPESVKKGIMLSGKDQLIYNAWRAAREAVNDHLDDIANTMGDEGVKTAFKKMSNLFHAKGQITNKIAALTKPTKGRFEKIGGATKEAAKYGAIAYGAKKIFGNSLGGGSSYEGQ